MSINPDFLAPCGLYCGVCAIYLARRDRNRKLQEKLLQLYRGETPGKGKLPGAEQLTAEEIGCDGCLAQNRFMHCQQCEIRACVLARGLEGCHQCDDFPCRYIDEFPMTVGKKVILRAVPYRRRHGTEKWVRDEEKRYHCPACGARAFRGARRCSRCQTLLDLD